MNDSILRQHLVELLRGGQAHTTVEQALDGLKPALLNVRQANGAHSIWEEFEHMRLAQQDILRYTVDAAWVSPPVLLFSGKSVGNLSIRWEIPVKISRAFAKSKGASPRTICVPSRVAAPFAFMRSLRCAITSD